MSVYFEWQNFAAEICRLSVIYSGAGSSITVASSIVLESLQWRCGFRWQAMSERWG